MTKHSQPVGFAEGIYFGMSDEDYHNDPALSHSGITRILISERDYWETSCLNPAREYKETEAQKFGKLAELYLLEEKKFLKTYSVAGGGYHPDRKVLTRVQFEDVVLSARILREDPKMAAYFTHGYAQVSIFYRDPATGVMLRVRPDWMRTFGCIDLKRLRSIQASKLGWDIVEYGYDLQESMYRAGMAHAKEKLRAGKFKVFGEHNKEWLKAFADDPDCMFRFVFQRSVKPFIFAVRHFDRKIQSTAAGLVEEGIDKYSKAIGKYGTGVWPAGSPVPEEFSEYHLPRRAFDR